MSNFRCWRAEWHLIKVLMCFKFQILFCHSHTYHDTAIHMYMWTTFCAQKNSSTFLFIYCASPLARASNMGRVHRSRVRFNNTKECYSAGWERGFKFMRHRSPFIIRQTASRLKNSAEKNAEQRGRANLIRPRTWGFMKCCCSQDGKQIYERECGECGDYKRRRVSLYWKGAVSARSRRCSVLAHRPPTTSSVFYVRRLMNFVACWTRVW